MDRYRWHCAEAGHHLPARPDTCTEVVSVWLFPKLHPRVQTGSCTHGARRCRRESPVPTTYHVIGWGCHLVVQPPGLAPPPAAVHPQPGCWMSLGQGPRPVALTWPGHRLCVGLYVHLHCGSCASVHMAGWGSGPAKCVCKCHCEFLFTCAGVLGASGGVCLCVVHAPVHVAG